ncbi:nuclear transport factor 2 family protein [Sphingobium sp. EM0848]|uniref:nuclear transport factor 2 family protein n=1 Tax=Sphingobium sp. EM0848 TaxID=2743473 RepID=UPI00159C4C72|nr:nuclear transport factor 2 family protein [Sphingobium sp. EM0848]
MTDTAVKIDNVAIARDYFRLLDAKSPDMLSLFTPDFEFYYPKYGRGGGAEQLMDVVVGLSARVETMEHDVSDYLFVAEGDHVVVEGTTRGVLSNGDKWAAGETPCGRFCNVFTFRDGKIARVAVYLDPDYLNEAESAFLWGREGRQW